MELELVWGGKRESCSDLGPNSTPSFVGIQVFSVITPCSPDHREKYRGQTRITTASRPEVMGASGDGCPIQGRATGHLGTPASSWGTLALGFPRLETA
jgi:hypothetical protein